nr:hypothetical protein [Tanacetum cinerariifolium]
MSNLKDSTITYREDPYAYMEAAFQAPPSPDYLRSPEHPPLPAYALDFVLEPVYPEFMPSEGDDDEDPKEDPVNYPTDRDDDDGDEEKESSRYEVDDEDEDKDEEEEHPPLAESVPPPVYRVTARMPILSPPLPISSPPLPASPTYPLGDKAVMIRLRAEAPSTSHPLPSSLRFKVSESSFAHTTRHTRGFRADYEFFGTLNNEIRRDPEREVVKDYRITDSRLLMIDTASRGTDSAKDTMDTDGSIAETTKNDTKKNHHITPATTTTTTTTHVTNAQLKVLIDQGVADALVARDADRSQNGKDSHDSRTCVRRQALPAHSQMHNNIMAAGGSRDRPPMLAPGRYPQWRSRFMTIVKQQHKLDEVSYHKLFDILKQYQNEFNELRAEKLARNANPLALVATAQASQYPFYQTPRSHRSSAPSPKPSIPSRSQTTTKHKGKEIAKPITPPSETASKEDSDPEQAQRDKDMQKNLAFIAKYFKKINKPTNNNLRTSSNSKNKNMDIAP